MNSKKNQDKEFLFTSKANVLYSLKDRIKKSKIEKLYYFTVEDWKINRGKHLNNIRNTFSSNIIVRSSSFGEDSVDKSEAGKFLSVLNVNPKSNTELSRAIQRVINSYNSHSVLDSKNQVLIQNQTKNVILSGVLFTKTLESDSPYYVINFETSGSTDSVTKGKVSNTIKIFNNTKQNQIPSKWKKLISAVKEIERLTGNDSLDIEFAITPIDVIIFQIRPLTTVRKNLSKDVIKFVGNKINKNEELYLQLKKRHSKIHNDIIFSNMVDWNPAEIIGNNPRVFDYSLYDFLIMKESWIKGRNLLGYTEIKDHDLMESFSGHPYVNVLTSFNSFFPSEMKNSIRKKLIKYYISKLEKNPHLHDKVEFEILFTCYDFSLDNRMKDLKKFGFTSIEIKTIKDILKKFTNNLIQKTPEIIKNTESSLRILNEKRLDNQNSNHDYKTQLISAEILLKDCKKYGAINFSAIARLAFVSNILLRGLYENHNIKRTDIENFMKSIPSPVTEFQNDLNDLKLNKVSRNEFLRKYGHLRSGTYDLTVQRYDKIPKFLEYMIELKPPKSIKNKQSISEKQVNKIISQHNLRFNEMTFLDYTKNTISLREKVKFEFTKSLSDAIELILSAGKALGFTPNELSNLEINDFFKYKIMNKNQLKKFWKKKISYQMSQYKKNTRVELPPLITSKNDFSVIEYHITSPNYITSKKVTDVTLLLDSIDTSVEIDSKLILIENADPGFDWIFSKNPAGLITKYGGIASHMAIRCAELGLPAAIGCGELLFDKLRISTKVTLDCKNNDILILDYKQKNSFSEERKILKSLGYIK